jgi:hypothetical protein
LSQQERGETKKSRQFANFNSFLARKVRAMPPKKLQFALPLASGIKAAALLPTYAVILITDILIIIQKK